MATVGHVAVGLAAARAYQHGRPSRVGLPQRSGQGWPCCPTPTSSGSLSASAYPGSVGYRGASHSRPSQIALGLLSWARCRTVQRRSASRTAHSCQHRSGESRTPRHAHGWRSGMCPAVAIRSDSLLRAVAPHSRSRQSVLGMLSPYGAIVVLVELAVFSPLLFFALRPAGARGEARRDWRAHRAVGSVRMADVPPTGPVRESIVGFVLRDRTLSRGGISRSRPFEPLSEACRKRTRAGSWGRRMVKGGSLRPNHGRRRAGPPKPRPRRMRECRSIRSENGVVVTAF